MGVLGISRGPGMACEQQSCHSIGARIQFRNWPGGASYGFKGQNKRSNLMASVGPEREICTECFSSWQ